MATRKAASGNSPASASSSTSDQGAQPQDQQPESVQPDLGYEAAKDELVKIVSRLEGGQVGIEEAMTLWRRADALAKHCENWLHEASASLTATTEDPGETKSSKDSGTSTDS